MNQNQRFQASEDVVAREVAGEMVLLDLSSGLYFGLDPVGSRIWERLSAGACSLAEVCDAIEAEFDAPRNQIDQDVRALFADLANRKLINQLAV